MPKDINYNCLPDSIEIMEWNNFHDCYKEIIKFPTSLNKIKIKHNHIEILNYFKNATFDIDIKFKNANANANANINDDIWSNPLNTWP
jgi:hypothetical protein